MHVIRLTHTEIQNLHHALSDALVHKREFRVSADDHSFKYKLGGEMWTAPQGVLERPNVPSIVEVEPPADIFGLPPRDIDIEPGTLVVDVRDLPFVSARTGVVVPRHPSLEDGEVAVEWSGQSGQYIVPLAELRIVSPDMHAADSSGD